MLFELGSQNESCSRADRRFECSVAWCRRPSRGKKQFGYSGEVMAFDCLKDALVELGHTLVESTLPAPHKLHTARRRQMAMKAYDPLCNGHWDVLLVEYNRIDEAWQHKCVRSSGVVFAVLDFYGHTDKHTHPMVDVRRYLTMYPEAENTYLGFYIKPGEPDGPQHIRQPAGVIWGKRKEYFTPTVISVLNKLLETFPNLILHATVANKKGRPITVPGLSSKVHYHGVMKHDDFTKMLRNSRFVMGLGHPLYGPTALEALSFGLRYFNFHHEKTFRHPMGSNFTSQHDYLGRLATSHPDHVCNFDIYKDPQSLDLCVRKALEATNFTPFVPPDYQWVNFVPRVERVFQGLKPTTPPIATMKSSSESNLQRTKGIASW